MTEQWTQYHLDNATPEAIVAAQKDGLLDAILNGTAEAGGPSDEGQRNDGQRSEAWLKQASPVEIVAAQDAGELRNILSGRTDEVIAAKQAQASQREAEKASFATLGKLRETLSRFGVNLPDDWGSK